ncbi:MAG: 50S ribosomal protein L37ae [Candidatus Micrarchaeota archaeon]|nr:50S ribosomal protein L37ae [Candidatus Micrarchaeota archaeon]MDE1849196.1 50S ribosomal protein L37ae [Candidatus Micrarchaeota archaeon]MDE1851534.1 50S ribosomal protein L37ae [Candidatus Micrarchaeota archaeon]
MAKGAIRYGVGLRKRAMAVKKEKSSRYRCDLCGKVAVKRISYAIWRCRHCNATFAGGAYTFKTAAGEMVSRIMGRSGA